MNAAPDPAHPAFIGELAEALVRLETSGVQAAWDTFVRGYGPTRSLAASLDPEARERLRREFIAFHDGFRTELGISVPREYWLTIGVRR